MSLHLTTKAGHAINIGAGKSQVNVSVVGHELINGDTIYTLACDCSDPSIPIDRASVRKRLTAYISSIVHGRVSQ